MAQRHKRSISLPPDLAEEIERAAESEGKTVSRWIAQTAAHRLKIEGGRRAVAAWELDHGALSATELAEGLARARALLAKRPTRRVSMRSA